MSIRTSRSRSWLCVERKGLIKTFKLKHMLQKILHFIKYNNATVIILALILILGGGALAAGPEGMGQRRVSVENVDNSLLIAADLGNFNMDFKIERVEEDENYYYATYSYLDLAVLDQAWQYQLSSKTQKISKKIKQDLGEYLAGFLVKHRQARARALKEEQRLAGLAGESKRLEVTEYSGLIGKTLNLAAKVFPGYEPVKKRELPAPILARPETPPTPLSEGGQSADNLTRIYNDYIAEHPDLFNTPVAEATSTPVDSAPVITPSGSPLSGGELIPEPASVDIIELPASTAAEPEAEPAAEPAPVAEPTPEPVPEAASESTNP